MSVQKKCAEKPNNKERIQDVAEGLFVEKGVHNTSLSDVAKATGISKGTLYYYFSSKNDLIFAITERQMAGLTEELLDLVANTMQDKSLAEAIGLVLEALIQAETRGRLHNYLMHEALTGNEALRERFRGKYSEWRQLLVANMAQLDPESVNHPYLADTIIAVIDGFILQSLLGARDIPTKEIGEYLSRF
ncbi:MULTISPECIES: TetR/AcrR family transcriptional regulator [Desulfosediminicola]|uniref:TetR/AcrR family transcriptional regulator n=1 Tax=Desulfosediminicola TaxID=2886823 RepID=UPI0010AC6550|nr:TetR/AcrR family transcriptional regulator [Desulfosediminicola ganghwensis]